MCLAIAISCAFAFTACDKKDEDKKEEKVSAQDAEKEATKVVEGFCDAVLDLDADKAKKYVDDEDVIDDKFSEIDGVDSLAEAFTKQLLEDNPGFEKYEAEYVEMYEILIDNAMDRADYEIIETEADGEDKFIVTVEIVAPDMDKMEKILSNIGVESKNKVKSKYTESYVTSLQEQWIREGKLTSSSTQAEFQEMVIDAMILEMLEMQKDESENIEFKTETKEKEIVVVKDGDKWVIDTEASELTED